MEYRINRSPEMYYSRVPLHGNKTVLFLFKISATVWVVASYGISYFLSFSSQTPPADPQTSLAGPQTQTCKILYPSETPSHPLAGP